MLNFNMRMKIIERYLKWITDYNLSHTPETFIEYLLLNNYLDTVQIKDDLKETETTHIVSKNGKETLITKEKL